MLFSLWWVCGSMGIITLLYLGYLRRQTRIEEKVRSGQLTGWWPRRLRGLGHVDRVHTVRQTAGKDRSRQCVEVRFAGPFDI